jgi:aminobenzoyl-glutamate utilization protein B
VKYRFHGRTAHAAANPETGRSALDAVELMNVGVNFLREHMPEKARIHYVITNGGGAPNVVPDDCEVWYYVRSPERHQVDELLERVHNIARGAALMTETTVDINFQAGSYNYLPNMVLTRHMSEVLDTIGGIEFEAGEVAFAQQIARAYDENLRRGVLKGDYLDDSFLGAGVTGVVLPIMDEGEVLPGSTDVSDVSWNTPVAQVWTSCFVAGAPGHSWANTATSGMSIGHKGMMHAAKAMASAAVELISNPDLIAQAKAEFDASTKGRPYQSPIPAHVVPRTSVPQS